MAKLMAIIGMACITASLSGCLAAAAAGAGAVGAVYVDKNYDISVNKKTPDHNTNREHHQAN